MKAGAAELQLRQQLKRLYDESEANNIAAMVMEHLTQANRLDRIKHQDNPLTEQQVYQLTEIEQRLLRHEPVQYVLGEAWFYNLRLYVNKHVLIPRPETEELVHWIITDVRTKGLNVFERRSAEADVTTQLKILDIGTGSGCIAIALKNEMPKAEVWGCDVSEEALNVARRNGSELDVRVDFQGLDILDEAQQRLLPSVDIIVSNPPYIPLKDKNSMHANVLNHEPHLALFVPDDDAVKFYKTIAQFARKRLHATGCLYFEIHEDLGEAVVALLKNEGYETELRKDMQGKHRMVKAQRRH